MLSVATLVLIALVALDKATAKLGLRRVPEQTICLCAVAAGVRGALLGAAALYALSHKTRKLSFQQKYALALVAAFAVDRLLQR